jgi:hypothetical protein
MTRPNGIPTLHVFTNANASWVIPGKCQEFEALAIFPEQTGLGAAYFIITTRALVIPTKPPGSKVWNPSGQHGLRLDSPKMRMIRLNCLPVHDWLRFPGMPFQMK